MVSELNVEYKVPDLYAIQVHTLNEFYSIGTPNDFINFGLDLLRHTQKSQVKLFLQKNEKKIKFSSKPVFTVYKQGEFELWTTKINNEQIAVAKEVFLFYNLPEGLQSGFSFALEVAVRTVIGVKDKYVLYQESISGEINKVSHSFLDHVSKQLLTTSQEPVN